MSNEFKRRQALEYHASGRPGKIEVVPTKETKTQNDLSLAYSPGVAEPCREIARDEDAAYQYTTKGNLVAVISNGTAVLGLGNIGAAASKPVMEGKGVLFKVFADIDVFDIEVKENDPEKFCEVVKTLEPTFGGINLEDIKAPECFYIEKRLREEMNIPVMHDDQHGTAIISGAALLNALELQRKKIQNVKIVVNGAGSAGLSCAMLYVALGARYENFTMFDISGVLHHGRTDLDDIKRNFSIKDPSVTLTAAMKNADVFIGLSAPDVVTPEMIKSMAKNPIVFAMANPDPEIAYEKAIATRKDLIMATGRSDYPNQVNNVLGFPYIFRGALDVRATTINEEMKLAAVKALAALTRTPVPESVVLAYNEKNIHFGPNYIIPKPIDSRLLAVVAPAVARAAMESGVARKPISDWTAYTQQLNERLGLDNQLFRILNNKAKQDPKKIIFTDGDALKVLKAVRVCMEDGICIPIIMGDEKKIRSLADKNAIDLKQIMIIDPTSEKWTAKRVEYGNIFFEKNCRKGYNQYESIRMMKDRLFFSYMMVNMKEADAVVSGPTKDYSSLIRPALRVIGTEKGVQKIAGMYIMVTKRGPLFLADATVNLNPTAAELADITLLVAKQILHLGIQPRIAMLSFSNFGSNKSPEARLVAQARELVKAKAPDLIVDGEMQGILAFNNELLKENYPFSELVGKEVNTLIFPTLAAGNIAYNLLKEINHADSIGPIMLGLNRAVQALQLGSQVRDIVNMAMIASIDAQSKARNA